MRKLLGIFAALMLLSIVAVGASAATLTQVNGFKAVKRSQSSVNLSWNAVSGANGYEIYCKSGSDSDYSKIKTINSGTTVKFTHWKLTLGETYSYKVRAWSQNGSKKYYGRFALSEVQIVPNKPSQLYANALGPNSIALSWSKGSGISGCAVYRSTSKTSGYKLIKTIGSYSKTTWTDTVNLSPSTTYYYKIRYYKNYNGVKVYGNASAVKSAVTKSAETETSALVNASSVRLAKTNIQLTATKTYTIKATMSPSNATFMSFTYKSSDKTIATVSSSGVIKGIKAGTAKITVTSADGKASAAINVTVRPFTGFYNDDNGYLKYNKNGILLKNATVNGIKFNSNGVYSSGNASLDSQIRTLIKENTNDNMTQKDKFKTLYYWVCNNYKYTLCEYISVGATGWAAYRAEPSIRNRSGNCYSYAASITMIARALGFNAIEKSGYFYTQRNGKNVCHGWCEIIENDKIYICDAELESCYSRPINLGWKLFFIEKSTAPCKYYYK